MFKRRMSDLKYDNAYAIIRIKSFNIKSPERRLGGIPHGAEAPGAVQNVAVIHPGVKTPMPFFIHQTYRVTEYSKAILGRPFFCFRQLHKKTYRPATRRFLIRKATPGHPAEKRPIITPPSSTEVQTFRRVAGSHFLSVFLKPAEDLNRRKP